MPPGKRLMILAPIIADRKGEHIGVFEDARRAGFVRVRVDGVVHDLEDRDHAGQATSATRSRSSSTA